MEPGIVCYHGLDEVLTYREPYESGFREAHIYFESNESTNLIRGLLHLLGWRYEIILYPKTLRGWSYQCKEMAFSAEDQRRVLKTFIEHESKGYRVRIDNERFEKR